MSELQEGDVEGDRLTATAASAICKGFCPSPGEVTWARTDWDSPVGFFSAMHVSNRRSVVRDMPFDWARVDFPRLRLAHKAALFLLQGQSLSAILIPNHQLRLAPEAGAGSAVYTAGHVLLRCDPWDYTLAVPELTRVVVAKLGEIPDGVSSSEVLAALAHDSAT
jgi:hypothetical protein